PTPARAAAPRAAPPSSAPPRISATTPAPAIPRPASARTRPSPTAPPAATATRAPRPTPARAAAARARTPSSALPRISATTPAPAIPRAASARTRPRPTAPPAATATRARRPAHDRPLRRHGGRPQELPLLPLHDHAGDAAIRPDHGHPAGRPVREPDGRDAQAEGPLRRGRRERPADGRGPRVPGEHPRPAASRAHALRPPDRARDERARDVQHRHAEAGLDPHANRGAGEGVDPACRQLRMLLDPLHS